MYQCSKVDFPVHSMFTYDAFLGTWVLESLGTQVQPQIILDLDYLPDYLSVSFAPLLKYRIVKIRKINVRKFYGEHFWNFLNLSLCEFLTRYPKS